MKELQGGATGPTKTGGIISQAFLREFFSLPNIHRLDGGSKKCVASRPHLARKVYQQSYKKGRNDNSGGGDARGQINVTNGGRVWALRHTPVISRLGQRFCFG
jgi:hypothetical protein